MPHEGRRPLPGVSRVRRGERLLASVVQSVDDCIFTTGVDGRLVTMNPAGQRLLGLVEDDLFDARGQGVGRAAEVGIGEDDDRGFGIRVDGVLGEEADRFQAVVEAFDRVRRLYGFRRVEVPTIEATQVFARSIGETTDIVEKIIAKERPDALLPTLGGQTALNLAIDRGEIIFEGHPRRAFEDDEVMRTIRG